jgi:catechol-2,3-dioxygenase
MAIVEQIGSVRYNVTGWEQAKRFWTETIWLPVVWASDEAGWAEFGPAEGCHIGINRWQGPGPIPHTDAAPTATFYVADAFKTTEELRARGVRCEDVQVVPGTVALGRFYDPEGNIFGIAGQAPQ